jgi:MFS transporter, PAT family, beta-lactamase induction signal transducer AmpG
MTLQETIKTYLDKRILWVFLMGCASGFPWVLIASALAAWLKDAGVSRTEIGLVGIAYGIYAFNFLWAPLVDRLNVAFITRIGQRKSWILLTQAAMALLTLLLATVQAPGEQLALVGMLIFAIAFFSATQDIAIDAFRVDHFSYGNQASIPAASAMATVGWWAGYSFPGYFAFAYADAVGWNTVYLMLAGCMATFILATCLVKEPVTDREALQHDIELQYLRGQKTRFQRVLTWLTVTAWEPLADFFKNHGLRLAVLILVFIFLFKVGEAFLGRMSIVFYKELFSNEEIGTYQKLYGGLATCVFALIGSIINVRLGVIRGLFIGGVAMAGSNLLFAWLAMAGPDKSILLFAILTDNFTTAFSTVAFVSFLTSLTGKAFSATQYALLASVGNAGRTVLASSGGWFVDWTGGNWPLFFVLTALMVIPGLLLLVFIRKPLEQISIHHKDSNG